MTRWTSTAEYCRALDENGVHAYEVTWPVRLSRWWEVRRGRAWFPRGRGESTPQVAELWARVERAFRLFDVAPSRPDPALTRQVATALLDEVDDHLSAVEDREVRAALGRAVEVVRGELARGA